MGLGLFSIEQKAAQGVSKNPFDLYLKNLFFLKFKNLGRIKSTQGKQNAELKNRITAMNYRLSL
jgi:hypothetical protein